MSPMTDLTLPENGSTSDAPPDWLPRKQAVDDAQITAFQAFLQSQLGLELTDYDALWRWSVAEPGPFWQAFAKWAGIRFDAPAQGEALTWTSVERAEWFAGARINYARQVLDRPATDAPAIIHQAESGEITTLGWAELQARVGELAAALVGLGIGEGDRVVAYLPNRAETVIAFLACASIGAVWSLCAPEMGAPTVAARFAQIAPKAIITVSAYDWAGKPRDRSAEVTELLAALPTLEHWITLGDAGSAQAPDSVRQHDFDALSHHGVALAPRDLPFDAALWVLFSSGTTGVPKPIVHGHGGVVLQHQALYRLHMDGSEADRFMWFSSTGWVMWNVQVSALMAGSTIVLAEGAPNAPSPARLWQLVGAQGVTLFGIGSAWLIQQMQAGTRPREITDLSHLRMLGATGSPLPPEVYDWAWRDIRQDLWIAPISGGTDFAGAFLAGHPALPLRKGVMQARCLGAHVQAFDDFGQPVTGEVGELVCTTPLPAMPLYFWGDDGARLHEAYFSTYPGVWRHGDWVRIDPDGGAVIFGRSDSTINRQGVRMGTADLYRVVEAEAAVADSLVVDLEYLGRPSRMILFVTLAEGAQLDDALRTRLRDRLRAEASPHHLPDDIVEAPAIPRTLTGKKMEVPVRKILLGLAPDKAATRGAMENPDSLDFYAAHAEALAAGQDGSGSAANSDKS